MWKTDHEFKKEGKQLKEWNGGGGGGGPGPRGFLG